LSEIRSSSVRLGHPARKASYSTFARALFWAAVIVATDHSSCYALPGAYFPSGSYLTRVSAWI
jgi:hypothetical protein